MPSGLPQYWMGDVGSSATVLQGEILSIGLDEEILVDWLEKRGILKPAEMAGLQRRTIISLARGLNRDVSDFDQAVVELERAVEIALDVIVRGDQATNTDEFVAKVLREIAEKTKREDFDGGAHAVDEALAELDRRELEQRDTARRARIDLLEAGVRQDALRRDAVARRIEGLVAVQHPAERPPWSPKFREHYKSFSDEGETKRGQLFSRGCR